LDPFEYPAPGSGGHYFSHGRQIDIGLIDGPLELSLDSMGHIQLESVLIGSHRLIQADQTRHPDPLDIISLHPRQNSPYPRQVRGDHPASAGQGVVSVLLLTLRYLPGRPGL
jgi:hypothetical protein